ncbi:MAG: complex I subunit 1/NuoH family protein [Candidatus Nitrosocosmicus sp.]
MGSITPDFRFGNFVGSIIQVVLVILAIVTVLILPIIFFTLFFVPLPVVNGQVLTPYLFFSMVVDPSRTLPIVKFLIHTALFKTILFPGFAFASLIAAATIFIERKLLAKMQLRVGPLYAGKVEGIFQLLADGLKLISKEIIVPSGSDKPIFWLAPMMFVATSAAVVSLIPVAAGWVVADVNVGLIAAFGILGFFPLIALLFSWASNSKYPFIGGLRALHQMIAFEIPFFLSALPVVILSGSLNLSDIARSQNYFWNILVMPINAFVFYISSLAELERIPFDLPEAESEIVAGWLTETSGMIFGLIQLGSYLKLYALSALFVILFLGGWYGPQIFPHELIPGASSSNINILKIISLSGFYNAVTVNSIFWFLVKTFGIILLMLITRGINPRIRIDILLHTGWYKLIVLTFINLFVVLTLIYGGILGPGGMIFPK